MERKASLLQGSSKGEGGGATGGKGLWGRMLAKIIDNVQARYGHQWLKKPLCNCCISPRAILGSVLGESAMRSLATCLGKHVCLRVQH